MSEIKTKYKVNEIFYSIQGEGYNTGLACVFIRFSGCNLSCDFCDTEHETYQEMKIDGIINELNNFQCKNVVITGGEPAYQKDLSKLIKALKENGYWISIETNGTGKVPENIDWITVSPKTRDFLKTGDELKIVYNNHSKKQLKDFLKLGFKHFYLQPKSLKNTDEVINIIKSMPEWKLSVQIHKLIGIK